MPLTLRPNIPKTTIGGETPVRCESLHVINLLTYGIDFEVALWRSRVGEEENGAATKVGARKQAKHQFSTREHPSWHCFDMGKVL